MNIDEKLYLLAVMPLMLWISVAIMDLLGILSIDWEYALKVAIAAGLWFMLCTMFRFAILLPYLKGKSDADR